MQLLPSYLNSIKFKFYHRYKCILYSLGKKTSGEKNITNRSESDFQTTNCINKESNSANTAFPQEASVSRCCYSSSNTLYTLKACNIVSLIIDTSKKINQTEGICMVTCFRSQV